MYTDLVKNVTISLDERTLSEARRLASEEGRSFNQIVRELIERWAAQDFDSAIRASFAYADRHAQPSDEPIPNREQRNERVAGREAWRKLGLLDEERYP